MASLLLIYLQVGAGVNQIADERAAHIVGGGNIWHPGQLSPLLQHEVERLTGHPASLRAIPPTNFVSPLALDTSGFVVIHL